MIIEYGNTTWTMGKYLPKKEIPSRPTQKCLHFHIQQAGPS